MVAPETVRREYPSIQPGTFNLFPPFYQEIHDLVRRLSRPLDADERSHGWTEAKRQKVFEQAYELEARLPIDTPLPRRLFEIDLPQAMEAQGITRGPTYKKALRIRRELAEDGKKYGIAAD